MVLSQRPDVVHYTLRRRATDSHLEQQLDVRGSRASLAHAARLLMYLARASPPLHYLGLGNSEARVLVLA